MTTALQDELAKRLIAARRNYEEHSAKSAALRELSSQVAGTLSLVKDAKQNLKDALENVKHISDPELQELVKQRMLEIWKA